MKRTPLAVAADPSFIVTQSADVTVASGGSVSLQCDIAELYSFCSHLVWLKLDRHKPMRLQVSDRVNLANPNDSTGASWVNVCQATILEATLDDAGMYYCVLSQGRFAHVGNGTRLTVTGENLNLIQVWSPCLSVCLSVYMSCVIYLSVYLSNRWVVSMYL